MSTWSITTEETAMAMLNPAHPGETIQMAIEETGWSVTTAAKRLGVSRNTL